jgi:invasion protein IalB
MQKRSIIIAALVLLASGAGAAAQSATQFGTFKQWNAYSHSEADGKVCYIASQPQDSKYSATIKQRDPAFFLITSRPAANTRNEASTIIGFPFKAESKVTVDIDGQKFTMFTQNDGAWMEDPTQESALITAMQSGTKMTVSGISRRGTEVSDNYSLAGVTAALSAIAKECP